MRKELKIDPAMKELWPDTKVGCFWYRVNVEQKNEALWSYLKKEIYKQVKDAIFDYGVNEIPNIKESRAAYKAFGKDPSRYRVSSEALIRRIGQGKGLYEVNTVVDANNLISIRSGFSVGSYDVSRLGEQLHLAASSPRLLEMMDKAVTKARSLDRLCRSLGLTPDDAVACGDSDNDTEMLCWAGVGCCMHNGLASVKEQCGYVCRNANSHGVLEVIERFF